MLISVYTAALSCGIGAGIIIDGLITINLLWRYIHSITTSFIVLCTLLITFMFPETEYTRSEPRSLDATSTVDANGGFSNTIDSTGAPSAYFKEATDISHSEGSVRSPNVEVTPPKKTYVQTLSLYSGTHTNEIYWKIFVHPIILLPPPPVLYATMVTSMTIGFLVAILSNFATFFSTLYGFEPYQSSLCFVAGVIGSLIRVFFGGHFSDAVADFFTRRLRTTLSSFQMATVFRIGQPVQFPCFFNTLSMCALTCTGFFLNYRAFLFLVLFHNLNLIQICKIRKPS